MSTQLLEVIEELNRREPLILTELNTRLRKRHRRHKDRRLPTNERNLTDVRTRMGTAIEAYLPDILDRVYPARGKSWVIVTYHTYPDIERIEDANPSEPDLRIEVKTIQTISEEPAANFDALIRDVHQHKDILCLILWDWVRDGDIEYPQADRVFFCQAYVIALIRDYAWLNNITDSGTRATRKMIDLDETIIDSGGGFKKEEHNLGKVARIDPDHVNAIKDLQPLRGHPSLEKYREFRLELRRRGFPRVLRSIFDPLGGQLEEKDDFRWKQVTWLATWKPLTPAGAPTIAVTAGPAKTHQIVALTQSLRRGDLILHLTDKYKWHLYAKTPYGLEKLGEGPKPKDAPDAIRVFLGLQTQP